MKSIRVIFFIFKLKNIFIAFCVDYFLKRITIKLRFNNPRPMPAKKKAKKPAKKAVKKVAKKKVAKKAKKCKKCK